jgi:hypothetical protein
MPLPTLEAGPPQPVPGRYAAFYRDTTLPPGVLDLYETGILFRDPTLCDATYKFGGFAAPHRYLIVSASATCLDRLSPGPEWGLCVWLPGRIFKVLGVHRGDPFSQTTLLEVPETMREAFTTARLSEMEESFAGQAARQFEAAHEAPVLPVHANRAWLDRLAYPLGVNDQGRFFEAWRHRVAIER